MDDIFNVVALRPAADIVNCPAVLDHFDLGFAVFAHHCQKLVCFYSSIGVRLTKRDDPLRNVTGFLKHLLNKDFGVCFREHADVFRNFLFREDAIEDMVFLFIRA